MYLDPPYTLTLVCRFSLLFSIHFLWYLQGEFFWQSRASWICNHFLYSHYLDVWNQGWILLVSLFRLAMGCLVAVSSQSIQFKSPARVYYINHKYVVTQFCGVQQKKKLNLQIFLFGIGLRWGCWCYHWEWRGAVGLRVWCLSHITKYTCQQIVWTRSNMSWEGLLSLQVIKVSTTLVEVIIRVKWIIVVSWMY